MPSMAPLFVPKAPSVRAHGKEGSDTKFLRLGSGAHVHVVVMLTMMLPCSQHNMLPAQGSVRGPLLPSRLTLTLGNPSQVPPHMSWPITHVGTSAVLSGPPRNGSH